MTACWRQVDDDSEDGGWEEAEDNEDWEEDDACIDVSKLAGPRRSHRPPCPS